MVEIFFQIHVISMFPGTEQICLKSKKKIRKIFKYFYYFYNMLKEIKQKNAKFYISRMYLKKINILNVNKF